MPALIYLHGFRSAPQSTKAQQLRTRMVVSGLDDRFWCEQLPVGAFEAIALIERALARFPDTTLVGSSLGGYYATHLAEKHGLRAVLVNPAVVAPISLADYLGPQTNLYTGESFEFTLDHVAQLRQLDVVEITQPERYWVLLETGDEVLDYRHAAMKYVGARQSIFEGGNHSFTHWGEFLDPVLEFAGFPILR